MISRTSAVVIGTVMVVAAVVVTLLIAEARYGGQTREETVGEPVQAVTSVPESLPTPNSTPLAIPTPDYSKWRYDSIQTKEMRVTGERIYHAEIATESGGDVNGVLTRAYLKVRCRNRPTAANEISLWIGWTVPRPSETSIMNREGLTELQGSQVRPGSLGSLWGPVLFDLRAGGSGILEVTWRIDDGPPATDTWSVSSSGHLILAPPVQVRQIARQLVSAEQLLVHVRDHQANEYFAEFDLDAGGQAEHPVQRVLAAC